MPRVGVGRLLSWVLRSAALGPEHQMGSCSAKIWPVEGFPRENDYCMCLLPGVFAQIKAGPGKAPPWSLTFTLCGHSLT